VVSGARVVAGFVSSVLDLIAMKPIAIFVWWLSNCANRIEFQERAELRRRVEAAARGGRPVLFASNHLSMFDDPVLPMALYRMGFRAVAELSALTALLFAWWVVPASAVPPVVLRGAALAWAVVIAVFGARKVWWSLGDLVNFIEACWAECQLDREGSDGRDQDAQSIADAVRSRVASLMPGKPIRSREGG
jgi:hypothetical protein